MLGHLVILVLVFWRNFTVFSMVATVKQKDREGGMEGGRKKKNKKEGRGKSKSLFTFSSRFVDVTCPLKYYCCFLLL